jgi:hypothetical protein
LPQLTLAVVARPAILTDAELELVLGLGEVRRLALHRGRSRLSLSQGDGIPFADELAFRWRLVAGALPDDLVRALVAFGLGE